MAIAMRRVGLWVAVMLAQSGRAAAFKAPRAGHARASVAPPRWLMFGPGEEYTVRVRKPLGIVFEELEVAGKGVRVADFVQGGNADRDGRIWIGDVLLQCSAIQFTKQMELGGFSNWERTMISASMEFDGVMAAIQSNDGRFGCVDVVMKFRRTPESLPRPVTDIRRDGDDETAVKWDALGGVKSGSASLPIRPPKDNF